MGRWGGPTALPNEVRFSAEASNFEKMKKKLRAFCDEKLKDHAELEAETESDDGTVDGHGIRSATAPIAAPGSAAARAGTPEGRSDLQSGRQGEGDTVAQMSRLSFDHAVPSLTEADTHISIVSSSLAMLPAKLGMVPVESGFGMPVNCPASPFSLGHTYEFEIYDCGE